MRWPWQRRAEELADDAATTAPAPKCPRRPAGEWRDLPAPQAVSLADATTAAEPLRFVRTLATRWQVPPALEQLGHRQDVTAPSGAALVSPAAPQVGYADAPLPVWPTVPAPTPTGAPELPPPARPLPRPVTASEPPTSPHVGESPVPGSVPTPSQPAAPDAVRPLVGRTSLLTLDPADLREVAPAPAAAAGPEEQVPPAATSSSTALPAAPPADRPPAPRAPADAPAPPPRPTTPGVPDWFRSGTLAPAEPLTEPTAAPSLPAAQATAQQAPAVATPAPEPVTPLLPGRPRRVPWPQAAANAAEPSDHPADDEPDHDEPVHDEPDHDEPTGAPADQAGHAPGHETEPETGAESDPAALDEPAAEPAQPLVDQPLADLHHPAAPHAGDPPHHPESSGIRRRERFAEAGTRTIRGQRRDATDPPELPTPEPPASVLRAAEVGVAEVRALELPGFELPGGEQHVSEPPAAEPSTSRPTAPREGAATAGMPVRRVLRVGAPLRAADRPRDGSPTAPDGPTDRTERPGAVQGLAAFVAAASAAVPDDLAPTTPGSHRPEPDAPAGSDVVEATGPATRDDTAHRVDRAEDARPDAAAVLELLRPREDVTQVPEPPQDPTGPASAPDVPWWATPDEHGRVPRRTELDDLDDDHDLDDEYEDASAAAVYDQVVRRLRHELLVERERAALLAD